MKTDTSVWININRTCYIKGRDGLVPTIITLLLIMMADRPLQEIVGRLFFLYSIAAIY